MNIFDEFIKKEKFIADKSIFYPGIGDDKILKKLTEKINSAAEDFKILYSNPETTEDDYLNAIAKGLVRFKEIDYPYLAQVFR